MTAIGGDEKRFNSDNHTIIRDSGGQLLREQRQTAMGAHWDTTFCPCDDPATRPEKVCAPQHTHPHPCLSPDGHTVVFTSNASWFAQSYEVELPQLS